MIELVIHYKEHSLVSQFTRVHAEKSSHVMWKLPTESWIRIINNVGASADPGGGLYCIARSLANDSERKRERESKAERDLSLSRSSWKTPTEKTCSHLGFSEVYGTQHHSKVSGTTRMWEGQTDYLFCCLSVWLVLSLSLSLSPWSKGRRAVQEGEKITRADK